MNRWLGALLVTVMLPAILLVTAKPLRAFGIYPAGTTGTDISFPACGDAFPASPGAFAIIGVTGGRALFQNPCLLSEFAWAQKASVAPSLYLNLNSPSGSTAFKAATGPRGTCATSDQTCLSYNYGYNTALFAVADARSQQTTAATWWLDVEAANTWDSNTAVNVPVIQGAIDYLKAQNMTVGLYSTAKQWQDIAGSYAPGLPVWTAGASDAASAPEYCAASHAFAGGPIWLVQYPTADQDSDLACPAALASSTSTSVPSVSPATPAPTAPPATPANLRITISTTTTVQLAWNAPAAPLDRYYLYIDATGAMLPVSGGVTSYTAQGLLPNTYYCFTLIAQNRVGYSGWTAWACGTTPSG